MTESNSIETNENKLSVGLWIGVLIGCLLGGGLMYLGSKEYIDGAWLRMKGVQVQAERTNGRIRRTRKSGTTYGVRYQFKVGNSPTLYNHSDATGRRDLWASVTKDEYSKTYREAKIQVLYLPSNPWINRPVVYGGSPMADHLAGLFLGLLIFLPCFLLLISESKKAFRK